MSKMVEDVVFNFRPNNWEGLETRTQARNKKSELIAQLSGGDLKSKLLGEKLTACSISNPCGSSICPACLRKLRKTFVPDTVASSAIGTILGDGYLNSFSANVGKGHYKFGRLDRANLQSLNEQLQKHLQEAHLPLVFAGINALAFTSVQGGGKGFWNLRVFGVCVSLTSTELRQRLGHLYRDQGLEVREVYRTKYWSTLCRIIDPQFRGKRFSDAGKTHRVPVSTIQVRELAIWMNQYPLTARYVLAGCRITPEGLIRPTLAVADEIWELRDKLRNEITPIIREPRNWHGLRIGMTLADSAEVLMATQIHNVRSGNDRYLKKTLALVGHDGWVCPKADIRVSRSGPRDGVFHFPVLGGT